MSKLITCDLDGVLYQYKRAGLLYKIFRLIRKITLPVSERLWTRILSIYALTFSPNIELIKILSYYQKHGWDILIVTGRYRMKRVEKQLKDLGLDVPIEWCETRRKKIWTIKNLNPQFHIDDEEYIEKELRKYNIPTLRIKSSSY